jgi:hypothetical protein
MKKFAIFSLTVLFAFSVVQAQGTTSGKGKPAEVRNEKKTDRVPLKKLAGTTVSETSKNSFIADFGNNTDVKWKRSLNFDEATFTKDKRQTTAYYDSDGKLVGTTSPVAFSDLPLKGRELIKEKYKDFTPEVAIFFDDNELNDTDMVLWATQFEDEDLYFVQMAKGSDKIVLMVKTGGEVSYFKKL